MNMPVTPDSREKAHLGRCEKGERSFSPGIHILIVMLDILLLQHTIFGSYKSALATEPHWHS